MQPSWSLLHSSEETGIKEKTNHDQEIDATQGRCYESSKEGSLT